MRRKLVRTISFVVACLVVGTAPSLYAETIMKLNLGGDAAADFEFDAGVLATLDDGVGATNGKQNTSVEFLDILESVGADIAADASLTMAGITASTPSTTFDGSLMIQDFTLGSLAVYATDNSLLLSANISLSAMTGPLGEDAQGVFLAFGDVTGGSMAKYLAPGSLRVKMKLPTVIGGFSVSPLPGAPPPLTHLAPLDPFTATAISFEILAQAIPEPAGVTLLGMGIAMLAAAARRQRRS